MKNIILSIALFGITLTIKAQDETVNGKLTVKGHIYGQYVHTTDNNATGALFTYPGNQNLYLGAGKDQNGNKNEIILYNLSCNGGCNVPQIQLLTDKLYTSGKVGIGTKNPAELLDISGAGMRIGSTSFNLDEQSYINLYEGTNHHGVRLYLNGNSNKFSLKTRLNQIDQNILVIPYAGTYAGNVGIGTDNPDSKLAVNGEIHTKEVKVDLVGWSDFVFFDNYKLPTLEEVEKHIKEKGHLKNIPSAKEVEENGILLGEMDSKLLQKIEELTLYTIHQEKQIQNLEKENEKVKLLNEKLLELQTRLEKLESEK